MKLCPNPNCPYGKAISKGEYCPECGTSIRDVGFSESGKILALKKDIKKGRKPAISPEDSVRYINGETKEEKAQRKREKHQLFTEDMDEDEIRNKMYGDMDNLAMQEAGTKWMKAGALLSFDPTNQMIASGLKALIDQNKLIIRQNELLLREIKKLNKS